MTNKLAHVKMVALVAATLSLMGCSGAAGYADLSGGPTAEDAGPPDLPDYALDDFDVDSMRFVTVADDYRLYLARGKSSPVCLLIYSDVSKWQGSCGSEMSTAGLPGLKVMIVGDDMPDKEGWTKVSENLLVEDR